MLRIGRNPSHCRWEGLVAWSAHPTPCWYWERQGVSPRASVHAHTFPNRHTVWLKVHSSSHAHHFHEQLSVLGGRCSAGPCWTCGGSVVPSRACGTTMGSLAWGGVPGLLSPRTGASLCAQCSRLRITITHTLKSDCVVSNMMKCRLARTVQAHGKCSCMWLPTLQPTAWQTRPQHEALA